ncbi:MAG: ester cyclase [Candidatus Heimdallarchaeota archaeon]
MTITRNLEIGTLWFEEMWSKEDFELAHKLIHHDYDPEWVHIPKKGPEQVIHEMKYFRSAFHDLKYTIKDIIANETKVWVYYRASAKHGGNAWGFEPTDKDIEFEGMTILEIDENGKVINRWGAFSFYDVLTDLELVPPFWELNKHFPQKE